MANTLRRALATLVRQAHAMHPLSVSWRLQRALDPSKPIFIPLGDSRKLSIRVHYHDVIGEDIFRHSYFEPDECHFVEHYLKPGMVFFDLGANLGQYTLIAAHAVSPSGQVHSFEPSERMFGELSFNVALNGFQNTCFLNRIAVSGANGSARLQKYPPGSEVYGSLGSQKWASQQPIGYEEVPTSTLDSYVESRGISRVDLIKIDIEGAELPALRGAQRLLSKPNGPAVVCELADVNTRGFGYSALETWDFLESLGYRLYAFDSKGHISGPATRPSNFSRAQNLVAIKPAGAAL